MPLPPIQYNRDVGAILAVRVDWPRSWPHRRGAHPISHTIRMLIDTGATASALSKRTAGKLGLPLVEQRILQSVNHEGPVDVYVADLTIVAADPPRLFENFRLVELELADEPVDGLIGVDILRHGVLEMNGPREEFSLLFGAPA